MKQPRIARDFAEQFVHPAIADRGNAEPGDASCDGRTFTHGMHGESSEGRKPLASHSHRICAREEHRVEIAGVRDGPVDRLKLEERNRNGVQAQILCRSDRLPRRRRRPHDEQPPPRGRISERLDSGALSSIAWARL